LRTAAASVSFNTVVIRCIPSSFIGWCHAMKNSIKTG
jgi:hypothetical protein